MTRFDPTKPLADGVTLLEASAGTGKTHAIGSMVVRLVAHEGVAVEAILAVTFTDAATAELRDRVRRRLREARDVVARAAADDGAPVPDDGLLPWLVATGRAEGTLLVMGARLTTALERFGDAPILTIHGWCQRLLRDHAFECGAELDAELLEDPDALLDEVVRDWWSGQAAALDPVVLGAIAASLQPARLRAIARKAANAELVLLPEVMDVAPALDALAGDCRAAGVTFATEWTRMRGELPQQLADWLGQKWISKVKWTADPSSRLAPIDAWVADPTPQAPAGLDCLTRAGLNNAGLALLDEPLFVAGTRLSEAHAALAAAVVAHGAALERAFAAWARDAFARRKAARRLRTFDDLLRDVRDALREPERGPRLAEAVCRAYRVALIDEFQDTDGVQWETFRTLFGGAGTRLALIGDPKQSIYEFRGADVHAYLAARGHATTRRVLPENRRSDGPLVHAVSHLYARGPLPFALDAIEYGDVEPYHQRVRIEGLAGAPLRLLFLDRTTPSFYAAKGSKPPEVKPIDKGVAHPRAAGAVARGIADVLATEACIVAADGTRTRVGARDCAVLVRSGRQAEQVIAALRARGIPAVRRTDESVFAGDEARELSVVLAAVLEPVEHRRLRAALATDLLGIPAARELEAERGLAPWSTGPGDVLAALDDDDGRAERWTERLLAWRACWERRGVMPALRAMLADLALPERLLALPDGERRLTNLLHLAELLHAAATERRLAPPAALAWLLRERDEGTLEAEARRVRLESDEDAVQVATVHGSKGLEYPLVWLPWLWDGTDARGDDLRLPVVRDVTDGATRHVLDLAPGAKERRQEALDDARFAEELRLLYVALTRARHRCTVVWGACKSAETSSLGHLLYATGTAAATARADTKELVDRLIRGGDEALLAPLHEIAEESQGCIEVVRVPETADEVPPVPAPSRTPAPPAPALEARPWRRRVPLDERWRIGSFTWMTRGGGTPGAPGDAPDDAPEALDDARAAPEESPGYDAAPAQLAGFPASADAGICLHWILEHASFAEHESLPGIVARGLGRSGFDALRWRDPVAAAVRAVCATPLRGTTGDDGAAWRLADVEPAARLSELAFTLPVRGGLRARQGGDFGSAALGAAFRDHAGGRVPDEYADRVAALRFTDFHGFLAGTMDVVVRHAGRWWVVDWKSNHLGARLADYAPARLLEEMTSHHYVLQYHLYLVALDRWLQARVPGYDYDRDMGGALYLFLRGMPPGADGNAGVFHDRPPVGRIRAMAAALGLAPAAVAAVSS